MNFFVLAFTEDMWYNKIEPFVRFSILLIFGHKNAVIHNVFANNLIKYANRLYDNTKDFTWRS